MSFRVSLGLQLDRRTLTRAAIVKVNRYYIALALLASAYARKQTEHQIEQRARAVTIIVIKNNNTVRESQSEQKNIK